MMPFIRPGESKCARAIAKSRAVLLASCKAAFSGLQANTNLEHDAGLSAETNNILAKCRGLSYRFEWTQFLPEESLAYPGTIS